MKIICFWIVLFFNVGAFGQDKVLTLSGDTLDVTIPGDPWGELKIHYSNLGQSLDYGFKRIAVIYKKDSIRIHSAGQIKAYWRQKPGKHLGSGYFETTTILDNDLEITPEKRNAFRGNAMQVFRQQIFNGEKIKIWYYRKHSGSQYATEYYFFELPNVEGKIIFTRYHDWSTWAEQDPVFKQINRDLPRPKNRVDALFIYFEKVATMYESQTL